MTFRYENFKAIDDDLGLLIRRQEIHDLGAEWLELVDITTSVVWPFVVIFKSGEVEYHSERRKGWHKTDVGCEISRKAAERIAAELSTLKNKQGIELSPDSALEVVRRAVFSLVTRGGSILTTIPDYQVSWKL